MPIPPIYTDIDLDMLDVLIKKEREEQREQEEAQNQPFLQLPTPEPPINYEKEPKKENDDETIIIDL